MIFESLTHSATQVKKESTMIISLNLYQFVHWKGKTKKDQLTCVIIKIKSRIIKRVKS